jgi:Spy/CpxP family protein refolding chaperone
MKRRTALLAVLALFLSGVLVGVVATHGFYLYKVRQPGGLGELGSRVVAWELRQRLDLTAEQEREIDAILAETRREGLAIRQRTIADVMALLERNHARLAAVLTPAQREEFERFRLRHRRLVEGLFSSL